MTNTKAANRYALAIFEIAKENNLIEVILNDLKSIQSLINSSREFHNLVVSPVVNPDKKIAIFREIFGEQINKVSNQFLELLFKKKREILTAAIIGEYIGLYNKENNLTPVDIYSSIELDDNLKKSIETKLSKELDINIISNYKIDKELKGGIKIQIEDWVYDASIKSKLEAIKVSLTSNIN